MPETIQRRERRNGAYESKQSRPGTRGGDAWDNTEGEKEMRVKLDKSGQSPEGEWPRQDRREQKAKACKSRQSRPSTRRGLDARNNIKGKQERLTKVDKVRQAPWENARDNTEGKKERRV